MIFFLRGGGERESAMPMHEWQNVWCSGDHWGRGPRAFGPRKLSGARCAEGFRLRCEIQTNENWETHLSSEVRMRDMCRDSVIWHISTHCDFYHWKESRIELFGIRAAIPLLHSRAKFEHKDATHLTSHNSLSSGFPTFSLPFIGVSILIHTGHTQNNRHDSPFLVAVRFLSNFGMKND